MSEILARHSARDLSLQNQNKPIPPRKTNLTPVVQFAPSRTITLAPIDLLHRLGVVTTPAVENLADICSTWAYFRYLWAFEIPSGNKQTSQLRLSSAARNIDFHQKGLLSDQIGVGMAALLLGDYLGAPLAADVDVALEDRVNWNVGLQFGASPDYLFFDAAQTALYVVECKGTQTSRSASIDQLRRGTEQVPSLIFNNGQQPPSLVVATCLSRSGTRVLIIDPPEEGNESAGAPEKARRTGERQWRPRNDQEFARANRQIAESKLLAYAGDFQTASEKRERANSPVARTPRLEQLETVTLENELGDFRGVWERVGLRDRIRLEVFQGMEAGIYDSVVGEDVAEKAEVERSFLERVTELRVASGGPIQPLYREEVSGIRVSSLAVDGTLLELRVIAQ